MPRAHFPLLPMSRTGLVLALGFLFGNSASGQDFGSAQSFGPAGVSAVASLPGGGLIAGGYFPGGGPCDFDPGPGVVTLNGSGRWDGWVSKLDPAGALVWVRQLAASGEEGLVTALAHDSNGAIYLTGRLDGSADFDPGPGSLVLGNPLAINQFFVWKLTAGGELAWARVIGPFGGGSGRGIGVDAAGRVWITGTFRFSGDFDPGPSTFTLNGAGMDDVFMLVLDADGGFVDAKRVGGPGNDEPHDLAIDSQGRPVVVGAFNGTADFDPGAGVVQLDGAGDPFVLALEADGDFRWVSHLAGGPFWDHAFAVAVTADDGVVVGGHFRESIDLDPGAGIVLESSPGAESGYVVKLDDQGRHVWSGALAGSTTTGGAGSSHVSAAAVGPAGDVYLTGSFTNVVDFDLGPGLFSLVSKNYGYDAFVVALGAHGDFRWAGRLGGHGGAEYASAIALPVTPSDPPVTEVVTFGGFGQPGDYDPGLGTFTLTPIGSDSFVSRLTDAFALPVVHRVPVDFPTVQQAIDAARHRDTIVVAPGTYVENVDFRGQHLVLKSEAGPDVTILDGGGTGPVITFRDGEDASTLLEGFTIRNGWAGSVAAGLEGGGVRIAGDASPTVRGNVISGNLASSAGAGISIRTGRAVIEGNEIRGNAQLAGSTGGVGGGGIAVIVASPLIQDNVIADNRWNQYGLGGGGISVYGNSGTTFIERNRIFDNEAPSQGGGVTLGGNVSVLTNNLIYGNRSASGGGVYAGGGSGSAIYLLNNTIADNAATHGSAVFFVGRGPTMANNVLTSASREGPTVECGGMSAPPEWFSNVVYASRPKLEYAGGCEEPGGTNLVADPLYRHRAARDYRLTLASPAVDHGDNGWVLASVFGPAWDVDRRDRRLDAPGVPDTGIGEPPLVDAGAHEFIDLIFEDGFESGDMTAWSASSGR